MPRTSTIRFLTPTTNQKGDLFTRLMAHLFQALGYEISGLDVVKPGREVDIEGRHLYQPTFLRAECKAHEARMGGRDLNAFYGVVTREREKTKQRIDAYFVSLGGFTEPGKNQEEESGENATILLDSPKVIAALEKHGLLLDDAAAAARAGQCAGLATQNVGALESIELVAYEKGYVKVVYYAQQGQRTHFALIHADGTALAKAPAQEVIDADQAVGGTLHELIYLAPAPAVADLRAAQDAALTHYRHWLSTECSYMQLDGLPADNDISSTKLKLERLFIPLKAELLNYEGPDEVNPNPVIKWDDFDFDPDDDEAIESISDFIAYSRTPEPISKLLSPSKRLAFLAPPGGGKSTLLKRLATEYGFADQKIQFADEMPAHDWLPLLIRCRDLQKRAKKPFIKLLEYLPEQVNMLPEPAAAFKAYIHEALQLGRVLLLVDGLDEIAKEQSRKVFTKNLVSFLAMFPQVTLVLTSREAGFRIVADVVANQCVQYKLAPFTEEDVQHLCVQWHVAVINDNEEVRQKALKLAKAIWDNKHIRRLAQNPLLLTTLFVVNRRQGGQLPKNRLLLYSKAVEVLVQTWNAEAFEPLDEAETLAMLSYLACYMMENDRQTIGQRELLHVLSQAQRVVPELRFMQTSPANFVKLVEYRSSLLMQVGSDIIEEEEQEVFEFRHLTFQEYLAAKGYVEGYHPRNDDNIPLVELLEPHFGQASWREVIPLAAGLAKRNAEAIIVRLVESCLSLPASANTPNSELRATVDILRRCILDEVLITSPEVLDAALQQLGRLIPAALAPDFAADMLDSKFEKLYRRVLEQSYMASTDDWHEYEEAFTQLNLLWIERKSNGNDNLVIRKILELLKDSDSLNILRALAALTNLGFRELLGFRRLITNRIPLETTAQQGSELYTKLNDLLLTSDKRILLATTSALKWLPNITTDSILPPVTLIASLFRLLSEMEDEDVTTEPARGIYGQIAAALCNQPLLTRDALIGENIGKYSLGFMGYPGEFLTRHTELVQLNARNILEVSIIAEWYRIVKVADDEFIDGVNDFYDVNPHYGLNNEFEVKRVIQILETFGERGKRLLANRAERRRIARGEKL